MYISCIFHVYFMYIPCCLCIIFRVGLERISRHKGRFQWNTGLTVSYSPSDWSYKVPGFPHTWLPWLFHDNFLIFHDHLSSRYCIRIILWKTSESGDFLDCCLKHTNLVKLWGKIGKIPRLITKFHDFWPIFHVPWLFHDHFHFPGFPVSVGTLRCFFFHFFE